MMKAKFVVALVLSCVVTSGIYALNENVVIWENMYQFVETDAQRLEIIEKIAAFKDREFAPVLLKALEDVVATKIESGPVSEQYARNQLTRIIIRELGELKAIEADELIYRIFIEVTEPLLKGEAAIALGMMRSEQYAKPLSIELASINLSAVPSIARNQEIIAHGLVKSLEAMRSPEGYEQVFLASVGWYSPASGVRDTAKKATLTMIDDPSDILLSIMSTNKDPEIKIIALETSLASKASNEKKAKAAAAALKIGLEFVTPDVALRAAYARLRMSGLVALGRLQDHSVENVALLEQIVKMDKKDDASLAETLNAFVALGVNGTDEAARYLSSLLVKYNEMERSKGNTPRDKSLIRQLVISMGATKNPLVKSALSQCLYVDYDNSIVRLVKEALASFPAQ